MLLEGIPKGSSLSIDSPVGPLAEAEALVSGAISSPAEASFISSPDISEKN
jgi:hypothetical protein